MTGGNLRVVTGKDTVTAREQLEYRERERIVDRRRATSWWRDRPAA